MPDAASKLNEDALRRVLHVAKLLGVSGDLDQILSVIIDAMRDSLDAERATVFEYDAAAKELFSTVAHGLEQAALNGGEGIRIPVSAGLAGQAATTRSIINVHDAYADPRFNQAVDRQTGFRTRSVLSIPLIDVDGELIGVTQVLNKRGRPFDEHDEEIAETLAAQAAVAMKRARLFQDRIVREKLERDLQVARDIQQQTFPLELPTLEGFDIAAWNQPADSTGGDAFDVIGFDHKAAEVVILGSTQPATQALLMIADATGHGIGPALSVTQLRSMLRMGLRVGAHLQSLARHINEQLCDDLPEGRFITAWLGLLDTQTKTLTSFSAGQAPLLHYQAATGKVRTLSADTLPFGVFAETEIIIEPAIALAPGDIFAALSDGFFEATNGDARFGTPRTIQTITAARELSADQIIESLRRDVDQFSAGRPADDDQTAVIVKRCS